MHGGLTYRTIPDLNGWLLYINVVSLDETVALVQSLGGSIVTPKGCGAPGRLGGDHGRSREEHLWALAGGSKRLSAAAAGLG